MNEEMLAATSLNQVQSYDQLGYDSRMNKIPGAGFNGVGTKNYVKALAFDSQFEGVDANKLTSNRLNHVIDLGDVKLDGTKGRIEVVDRGRVTGIVGKK